MPYTRITGTGSYVPEKVVTNFDLEKMMDTSDEWIRQRTGITERHIGAEGDGASDYAFEASKLALDAAGVEPEDLDVVILATMTPDYLLPAGSCYLQTKLGAKNAAVFDLVAACSGFIYGMSVADQFISSGRYKKILVAGSEFFSNRIDWSDRGAAILFGDGSGAAVFEATDEPGGVLTFHLHADGTQAECLWVKGGGSVCPPTHERLDDGTMWVQMKGRELFKLGTRAFVDAAREALDATGYTTADIDFFVPHQANARIIELVASTLELPLEKVIINIDRYGNTVAASVPIALDEAVRGGRIKKDDLVLFASFGGGLTWASALMRW